MIYITRFEQDNKKFITIEIIVIFKYVIKIYNYNIIIYNTWRSESSSKPKYRYEKLESINFMIGRIVDRMSNSDYMEKYQIPINPYRIMTIKLFSKAKKYFIKSSLSLKDLTED